MQRKIDRLTQRGVDRLVEEVDRARAAGETILSRRVADGDGLYVQIPEVSWISLFWFERKRHEMGLGSARTVGLKDARASNAEIRRKLAKGINPLAERTAERAKAKLDAAKAINFKQCAEAYIKAHRAGWRSDKHAAQWVTTLETYVYPVMGELPVGAINTALIMKVLEQEVRDAPDEPTTPLWTAKTETASRLRGRIESILDWAKVRGFRDGENPARWRGHLDKLLPARAKVREVEHHAALPYAELPDFMTELRKQEGVAPRALDKLIVLYPTSAPFGGRQVPALRVRIPPKRNPKITTGKPAPKAPAPESVLPDFDDNIDDL